MTLFLLYPPTCWSQSGKNLQTLGLRWRAIPSNGFFRMSQNSRFPCFSLISDKALEFDHIIILIIIIISVMFERTKQQNNARYIKVKVEHYLLFMFSPPKISLTVWRIEYICLHLCTVSYLIQPSSKPSWPFIPTGAIPMQKTTIPTKKVKIMSTIAIPILMPTTTIPKFL